MNKPIHVLEPESLVVNCCGFNASAYDCWVISWEVFDNGFVDESLICKNCLRVIKSRERPK